MTVAPQRQLTKTQREAFERRQKFRLSIENAAARLAAGKMGMPLQAAPVEVVKLEPAPPAVQPEAPAEKPRPKFWFHIVGANGSPTIREIKGVVCDEFGIPLRYLESHRRYEPLVTARQVAMYLAHELCPEKSLPMIARDFGGRDHTTVLHAFRAVPKKMASSADLAARVAKLIVKLGPLVQDGSVTAGESPAPQ